LLCGRWQKTDSSLSGTRLKSHRADQVTPLPAVGPDPATVFQARSCVRQLVTQNLSMIHRRREEQRTQLNASIGDYKASD
jgi:hypothetical protein